VTVAVANASVSYPSGHLLLGGGDSLRCLHDWIGRIDYLHVKSARSDVMRGILPEGAVVDHVWIVLEQDTLPGPGGLHRGDADLPSNRDDLRAWGF
jgi:sugar phosphate isomerase/epimerase